MPSPRVSSERRVSGAWVGGGDVPWSSSFGLSIFCRGASSGSMKGLIARAGGRSSVGACPVFLDAALPSPGLRFVCYAPPDVVEKTGIEGHRGGFGGRCHGSLAGGGLGF